MQGTVPIVMGGLLCHLLQINSIQRNTQFNDDKEFDTFKIRRNWLLVYIFVWILPYSGAFAWAYMESKAIGTTSMITIVSSACNFFVACVHAIFGMIIVCYNNDMQNNKNKYGLIRDSGYTNYLLHICVWIPVMAMICNVMFLNHNDVFKLFGVSGTPRDMKNYTWVITMTGIFDLFQAGAVASFVILMGVYDDHWVKDYIEAYMTKDVSI